MLKIERTVFGNTIGYRCPMGTGYKELICNSRNHDGEYGLIPGELIT